MGFDVGQLFVRILGDTKGLDGALKTSESKLKKFEKSAVATGQKLTLGVTLPILGIGAAMVKAASDAEETEAKFQTVFSSISDEAQGAADTLTDSFGLSSQKAQELLGNTGDLLTGFGFTQEAALDLSSQVNELAVDLASFTNFSGGAEGAADALTKALLGERESVKSLGISILDVDVKAKVLEQTQQGLIFETERQAKAYATMQIALEQSQNAQGDFARTQDSLANQMRQLKADIMDAAASLGKVLIPVITTIVKKIREWVGKLNEMSEAKKRSIIRIAAFAAAVGPAILIVGKLVGGIQALTVAMKALAAVKFVGPVGLIIAAVGSLAIGVKTLIDRQADLRSRFANTATAIGVVTEETDDLTAATNRYARALEEERPIVLSIAQGEADIASIREQTKDATDEERISVENYIQAIQDQIDILKKRDEATELTRNEVLVDAYNKEAAALREEFRVIEQTAAALEVLGDETDVNAAKNDALRRAVERLIEEGYSAGMADIESFIKLFIQLEEQTDNVTEATIRLRDTIISTSMDILTETSNNLKDRIDLESTFNQKVLEQSGDRVAVLELERDRALRIADELGANKANILKFYENEITKATEEEEAKRWTIQKEFAEMRDALILGTLTSITSGLTELGVSLAGAESGINTFGQLMAKVLEDILGMLPPLLIAAGLKAILLGNPLGWVMLAAGGGIALVQGLMKGSNELGATGDTFTPAPATTTATDFNLPENIANNLAPLTEIEEDTVVPDTAPIILDISIDGEAIDYQIQNSLNNNTIIVPQEAAP